ncbi:hypothetical protein B0T17DRAFT_503454 [Bombardia bombarda]|uniref:DUF7580 domain-containing protein n=1 Tax=Bombardia bombarda TaxID=252184 RepID=A0AA39XL05_9PEZI|nr:hypothetical protein B0T17DRAFT_503454 [Bombardia bombarda]
MSGFEVAGAVLGAISLVISALEHYKAGKGIANSFLKWHGHLDTLIFRLKDQKISFYFNILNLLRSVGLEDCSSLSPEECVSMLRDAETGRMIEDYLGHLSGTFLEVVGRYETCLQTLLTHISGLRRVPHLKTLLEDLNEENLSLKVIISGLKAQQEHTAREPSHDAAKLATKLGQVQANAASLFSALCKGYTCQCRSKHRAMIRLDSRVSLQRERRQKGARAREPTTFNLVLPHEAELFQEALVIILEDDKDVSNRTSAQAAWSQGQILRLELIANMLAHAQESAITMVHGEFEQSHADITLQGLLEQGYLDEDARLTPKQQTILALDIASSILQLQQTSWFSSPWNSRTIKFLISRSAATTSFSSISALPRAFVEEHLHRNATAPGPDPKTALLELAILLLEIWHHKPLELWAAKLADSLKVDTVEFRRIAAIRWLELTSERLPPHYLTAVEQCLAVCSGRLRYWDDGNFRRHYCENIIGPLLESCKAWIGVGAMD